MTPFNWCQFELRRNTIFVVWAISVVIYLAFAVW